MRFFLRTDAYMAAYFKFTCPKSETGVNKSTPLSEARLAIVKPELKPDPVDCPVVKNI